MGKGIALSFKTTFGSIDELKAQGITNYLHYVGSLYWTVKLNMWILNYKYENKILELIRK